MYPAIGLAGGACGGYGLLLDIRDVANPEAHRRRRRLEHVVLALGDVQQRRHEGPVHATSGAAARQPRCRETDKPEWGANAIFTLVDNKMTFKSYYKLPAPQTPFENCVAHNGSLIPIPGRDVMVQAWYQGGLSVFDWTDVVEPEGDRVLRPRSDGRRPKLVLAGSWSAYWYNGYIVSSEIARGLDIFELTPSGWLSQNELDAAKTVHFDYLNAQEQPKLVWPASFALARAYVDQLERSNGLAAARLAAVRGGLASAERLTGTSRRTALTKLAADLSKDAASASDQAKVADAGSCGQGSGSDTALSAA